MTEPEPLLGQRLSLALSLPQVHSTYAESKDSSLLQHDIAHPWRDTGHRWVSAGRPGPLSPPGPSTSQNMRRHAHPQPARAPLHMLACNPPPPPQVLGASA